MPESFLRLMPSRRAAPVTVNPRGSRQSWRTESPGWSGFFIGIVRSYSWSLMVVDRVHIAGVAAPGA